MCGLWTRSGYAVGAGGDLRERTQYLGVHVQRNGFRRRELLAGDGWRHRPAQQGPLCYPRQRHDADSVRLDRRLRLRHVLEPDRDGEGRGLRRVRLRHEEDGPPDAEGHEHADEHGLLDEDPPSRSGRPVRQYALHHQHDPQCEADVYGSRESRRDWRWVQAGAALGRFRKRCGDDPHLWRHDRGPGRRVGCGHRRRFGREGHVRPHSRRRRDGDGWRKRRRFKARRRMRVPMRCQARSSA